MGVPASLIEPSQFVLSRRYRRRSDPLDSLPRRPHAVPRIDLVSMRDQISRDSLLLRI